MKKIITGSIITIFILFLVLEWNLPLTIAKIEGTYFNINYENENFSEVPHNKDTLILKSDNTFDSRFFGTGMYKVTYGIFSTKIELIYNYEMGIGTFNTYFQNKLIEGPKIILNADLNHYYKKAK